MQTCKKNPKKLKIMMKAADWMFMILNGGVHVKSFDLYDFEATSVKPINVLLVHITRMSNAPIRQQSLLLTCSSR